MVKEGVTHDKIFETLKIMIVSLKLTNEFRYYILMCGIFTPERNIVKFWPQYEKIFINLVSADGKIGIKHLLQAIVLYFVRKYPDLIKYAATFMKLMYD